MRRPSRQLAIFTLSALDVLAMATGVFVLLLVMLMPYHRKVADAHASIEAARIAEAATVAQMQTLEAQGTMNRAEAEAAELGNLLRLVSEQAAAVGRRLDKTGSAAARLETTYERLRRIGQVAHERLRAGRAAVEGSAERNRDLAAELDDLNLQLAAARAEELEAGAVAIGAEQAFRALEAEERLLADEEIMAPEGAAARLRGELAALEAAGQRDHQELDGLGSRQALLDAQLGAEREEMAKLDAEIRALDTDSSTAQQLFDEQAQVRAREQEQWEAAEAALAEARLQLAAAQARHEALETTARGGEEPAGRALMEASPGVMGAVTARLDVPGDLSPAVEAALGAFARAVVFSGAEDLERAVQRLKGEGRGGVAGVAATRRGRGGGGRGGVRVVRASMGVRAGAWCARGRGGSVAFVGGRAAGAGEPGPAGPGAGGGAAVGAPGSKQLDDADLNRVQLTGCLGSEPLLYDVGNHPVAMLALACKRVWRAADGTLQLETTWVNLSAWEELAEQCGRLLHRGDRVYVEGALRLWTEVQATHSYACHTVVLDRIMLLVAGGLAPRRSDDDR